MLGCAKPWRSLAAEKLCETEFIDGVWFSNRHGLAKIPDHLCRNH
jgi:hypothetical protein